MDPNKVQIGHGSVPPRLQYRTPTAEGDPVIPHSTTHTSRRRSRRVAALAAAGALVALAATAVKPQATATAADATTSDDPVVVAAGDISTRTRLGGNLLTSAVVLSLHPDAVLTMGDNQYPDGSLEDFTTYYAPTWGQFKSITHPSPGHHEYRADNSASGYFRYFGAAATPRNPDCGSACSGYYSWDIGKWHMVALNTNGDDCGEVACDAASAQVAWLKADLAATSQPCVAAYFADPRWSSGLKHGSNPSLGPIWDALYDAHADLVLNGHEHVYERFAKQDPSGQAADQGIRQITVGTGGNGELYELGTPIANSQVRANDSRGVLRLALHDGSYSWGFEPVVGDTFRDSGADTCNAKV